MRGNLFLSYEKFLRVPKELYKSLFFAILPHRRGSISLKEGRIHHDRGVFDEESVVEEVSVKIVDELIDLVVSGVASPILRLHFVVAFNNLKAVLRLVGYTPFALEIFFADGDLQLICGVGIVAYHQVNVRIRAGRAACEGLCAV